MKFICARRVVLLFFILYKLLVGKYNPIFPMGGKNTASTTVLLLEAVLPV
jgi:hypothetical protein